MAVMSELLHKAQWRCATRSLIPGTIAACELGDGGAGRGDFKGLGIALAVRKARQGLPIQRENPTIQLESGGWMLLSGRGLADNRSPRS